MDLAQITPALYMVRIWATEEVLTLGRYWWQRNPLESWPTLSCCPR